MNKRQLTIGFLGAFMVAFLVFAPAAQTASAEHLASTLGSGSTGIAITADGQLSDIDDDVIVINDELQIGISSITIDGDSVPAEIFSEVAFTIQATAGDLIIDSLGDFDTTLSAGDGIFILADTDEVDITAAAGDALLWVPAPTHSASPSPRMEPLLT